MDKFYEEYAALNCDIYGLDELMRAVCNDKSISDKEAEARLAALYRLEAETYEFHPAFARDPAREDRDYETDLIGYDFANRR